MFSALFNDAPLGSLWIVLEEIWKELIPGYDQNSTRHDHPGCSIRRAGLTIEPIAMLHGTSQRHGGRGVCVSNVKGDSGETYFGYTPPRDVLVGGLVRLEIRHARFQGAARRERGARAENEVP